MESVTPFLWIQHPVEDALAFYRQTFDNVEVEVESDSMPGTPSSATLLIGGQRLHLFNAGPMQELTAAFSLMVDCDSQEEIDHLWNTLGEGGQPSRCGWVTDRFGVTWQVIPRDLRSWLSDPDRGAAVTEVMLTMDKLEIEPLLAALHETDA